MNIKWQHVLVLVLMGLFSSFSHAHQSSHSQISLQHDGYSLIGGWHIAIDDLQRSEGLDTDGNGELSWGELLMKQGLIYDLAMTHLRVEQGAMNCDINPQKIMLDKLSTGLYVYLPLKIKCPQFISQLNIKYDFLFSFDAQHKAIFSVQSNQSVQTTVFSQSNQSFEYNASKNQPLKVFLEFIWQGIWHILIGFDHILFLLSLLLPAALILHQGAWQKKLSIKLTLLNTTKIITAFTLAHSITLALSVFDIVSLSSRLVESIIAASVIVAALNNIKPVVHKRLWLLTFVFGLIHGFGFASVLSDVGLPLGEQGLALFGFNLGVELGQLAIVALILPVIVLLSYRRIYRQGMMQLGSLAIAGLAVIWLIERAADVELVSWL